MITGGKIMSILKEWEPHDDEIFQLDQITEKCKALKIDDPAILNLKSSYIKLKKKIINENINIEEPHRGAWLYYQYVNLATLSRLWQSSESITSIFSIIDNKGEYVAQRLGQEFCSFVLFCDACHSSLSLELSLINEPRSFDPKNNRENPCRNLDLDKNNQKRGELRNVRDKIAHLFVPSSGVYHDDKLNNQWLMPKPNAELKKYLNHYKEIMESVNRDEWFADNKKTARINEWCLDIFKWLVVLISKHWETLSVNQTLRFNVYKKSEKNCL
jgi:hypothetical protein